MLLLDHARVARPRIGPLVTRQRRRGRDGAAVPAVPSAALLFPVAAPMLVPARRCVRAPAAEVRRWLAVIADRHAQHVERHVLRPHRVPRAVVPIARIPVVILIDPVQAVVEEVVRTRLRCVIDGVARHAHQLRVRRHVDADLHAGRADADAELGLRLHRNGRRNGAQQQGHDEKQMAHRDPPVARARLRTGSALRHTARLTS